MEQPKFNQAIQGVVQDVDITEASDPQEFFTRIGKELQQRFNILKSSDQFKEAKTHLLTVVKTSSGLTEEQQDYYANEVNKLDNNARMIMFLRQEIRGL